MTVCVLEHPRRLSEKRFNDIANTPLWSCLMGGYAASAIAAGGHDVVFLDTTVTGWDFARSRRELLSLAPDLLCINAVYFWEHTTELFDFLAELRKEGFGGHINLFGFFPSLAWEVILRQVSAVDSIAVGECEDTLAELASGLHRADGFRNIPGLAIRSPHGPMLASLRPPAKDPDRFPFPMRDLTGVTTASILASRGCYNHCSFCPIPSFYGDGPLWRGRSPGSVVQEMTLMMDQGIRDFYFVDPNFIGPGKKGPERILDLLRRIETLKITFGMETRPSDLSPEILERLVAAGCKSLLLGIESGSSKILTDLGKHSTRNDGEHAIRLCRDAGIEPEVGFLMFVPEATVEDLRENLAFLERNRLLDRLDRTANLLCHCQIVLMGTSGYSRFQREGKLTQTGPLGFEGEVAYRDPGVAWVSEIMVHACHHVLREMSRPRSPIYWKIFACQAKGKEVNDYLVGLFNRLLQMVERKKEMTSVRILKNEIEKDFQDIIAV